MSSDVFSYNLPKSVIPIAVLYLSLWLYKYGNQVNSCENKVRVGSLSFVLHIMSIFEHNTPNEIFISDQSSPSNLVVFYATT